MRRAGRPTKLGQPLHRTSFTAPIEHIIFYLILGNENTVSAGVQKAAAYLEKDIEMGKYYQQALEVVERARAALGAEADVNEIANFARDHYWEIIQEQQEK